MALSIAAVRDGLKARLQTIVGLRAFDVAPDNPPIPCAVVIPVALDYDLAMGRGADTATFFVRLFVGKVAERAAQDKLDTYIASSGASSVKATVEGEPTLGGSCHFVRVTRWEQYGSWTLGNSQYLGVQFTMEVVG